MTYDTLQTDQPVYLIYEYRQDGDDRLRHVLEDDAEALRAMLDYYSGLSESSSEIVTGKFHAAKPDDEWLAPGDHYLTKQHGVSISHGLDTEE